MRRPGRALLPNPDRGRSAHGGRRLRRAATPALDDAPIASTGRGPQRRHGRPRRPPGGGPHLDQGPSAARRRRGRRRMQAELERREAQDVVDALGYMKGGMMKLGQMASYLDEGMPEPMREALAGLRSDAPPMTGDLALSEIEAGLGSRCTNCSNTSTQSRSRPHRPSKARTLDGRDVAVKVQYPGIADAIASTWTTRDARDDAQHDLPGSRPGRIGRGAPRPHQRGTRLRERSSQRPALRRLLPGPPGRSGSST